MKAKNLKLGMFIAMLFSFLTMSAYFHVDNVEYRIISSDDRTVSVVGPYSKTELKDLEIPARVMEGSLTYKVIAIDSKAFRDCNYNLRSIKIANSVTSIGYEAFYHCYELQSVELPSSLTSIGKSTFSGCKSLASINIPNSVTSIGDEAFYYCFNLQSVELPSSLTSIGVRAFSGCKSLTSINIPNSVTSIDNSAFSSCESITSVNIPNSVTSIGNDVFYGCKSLTYINIPNSVTSIGNTAFSFCSSLSMINVENNNPRYISIEGILYTKNDNNPECLISCPGGKSGTIFIPNSITSISEGAFAGCESLNSINIPNSVTSISEGAFAGCESLNSINIPNSVTSIGNYAFSDCSSIENVYCSWDSPIKARNTLFEEEVLKNAILHVPMGTKDNYEKVDPWRNFWNIEETDYSGIDAISDNSRNCKINVYDISGNLVLKDCLREDIRVLPKGIYILVSKDRTEKVVR